MKYTFHQIYNLTIFRDKESVLKCDSPPLIVNNNVNKDKQLKSVLKCKENKNKMNEILISI